MIMNLMNRQLVYPVLLITTVFSFTACDESSEDDEDEGNWVETTPFRGRPRSGAIAFTANDKAYVGLGYDGDDYLPDFYEFDPASGIWQQKDSFPGTLRERAVAFSINGIGYVGVGYNRDEDVEELKDFWKYDPGSDSWTKLKDFAGTRRYNAVGFSLNNMGYLGTGFDGDNFNNDFWQYNPSNDSWTEIRSLPGQKREEGLAFVIDGLAYVGAGRNNGLYEDDFWEFNPADNSWTSRSLDDEDDYYDEYLQATQRHDAIAFGFNGKGYIVGGSNGTIQSSVWEFNPANNAWEDKTAFEGASRTAAVSFILDGRIFVTTGQSGTRRFDDMWEFLPDDIFDEDD
ncbi:kelch repeat-containing protein [Fulvivirgaceae bacterium BMA12]|uniref:Kelch repeat-containing protein n=1 Tax=Agaribacillus aureus TaxID=3051825 RepID=A0ABT8L392_9BACT|nr:kelch repeat-containing protein [Fulvivirgaceae bacterium BMA12]